MIGENRSQVEVSIPKAIQEIPSVIFKDFIDPECLEKWHNMLIINRWMRQLVDIFLTTV